jgi:phosphopantothenoylcysteine decarboxylase/phosphopantothenate--cysteine ligase
VLVVQGRRIILGVTGSIAAYKAAELVRALKKEGADVRVVMTEAATHFVAPLTFEVLSGRRALVAPATANIIGKAACGIGDDLLSSTLLAAKPPVLIAPAMNLNMLGSPAVQENLARLRSRGWIVVESEEGELACGVEGAGRLASVEAIMAAARNALLGSTALSGTRVLVTAGRTEEPIDPVRYISNRSSGKMGFALAAAARGRGAEVILIAGATSVEPPAGVDLVRATTAEAMAEAVKDRAPGCGAVLMAAAVADFRPAVTAGTKIKKSAAARPTSIPLEYTSDVLKEISGSADGRVTVGFSLELENDRDAAARKLVEKRLNLIVMNNPAEPGCDFGSDFNKVTFLYGDGRVEELPLLPKSVVAERVLDRVEEMLKARGGGA